MKTVIRNILIGIVLLVSTNQALAYPPDNAAVLYYKAFLLMKEPNDALKKMLGQQLSIGDIRVNEQIRFWLESNHYAVKEIVTATEIKNCDWGLEYSEGLSTLLPHLAQCRLCAYLIVADGKVLAEKGDYKTAIERWLALYEMDRHMGDDLLVTRLVGISFSRRASNCIIDVLLKISDDCEMLEWLRGRLADVSSRYLSMRTAVGNEAVVWGHSFNKEGILELIQGSGLSKSEQDKVEQVLRQQDNNEFYVRVTEYYQRIISRMQIAYDLPYPQAKQASEDLNKEVENAAKEKPEAVITEVLLPAISEVLTIDTRKKTQLNAVLAGIEIYIIRAKTGKLPDELPAGLPKDLFSGKDFLYEKTNVGFTLTGQGKDLDKDIVQKYEFKIAK